MAWVRDGGAPDEVKVSFVVNKAEHPELVEWLWGLPFRKQSSVIRDVLSEAAKMVSGGAAQSMALSGQPSFAVTSPTKSNPKVVASKTSPSGGMTAATAAILRNMQEKF
ncbi:MAG: hypothetical protein PHQ60_02365 [Sideroxydans sp.]|nr:hypothetical protein [Sideroxydans sp.]MDD5056688.1 hypothetical protein [Sideroxydans sp.]